MNSSRVVPVSLGAASYEIRIAPTSLGSIAECADWWKGSSQAVIITDANVEVPYARQVAEALAEDLEVHLLVVDPGEPSKSTATAVALWECLLETGIDRKTVVLAVGGGVIGDLAGFIAATFARGLPFVQIPTSLLAQVDSSVGGKVGINLPAAKNIVGAFWQPRGVLIDPDVLETLPPREYQSGLAEVVKYGVIQDVEFFAWLEGNAQPINARENGPLVHAIARCCELKAEVVAEDEREVTGHRAILNFGHTFAHAIETVTEYGQFLHGEAVAIGMVQAAQLAERMGRVDAEFTSRLKQLLTIFDLPTVAPAGLDTDELISAMSRDKKVEAGQVRFVLPTKLGHVELTSDVAEEDLRAILQTRG
ncbi:MAG: 3-dehydroquinate synthase [Pirellulales bacterium]|nr:3-dehydroquinate synthase [Pirellulales bacterium]